MQIGTDGQRFPSVAKSIVPTCRAELAQAFDHWRPLNPSVVRDARTMGPHPSEATRLPHEHAAASVQNAWRAADTLADLRWYLAERVKLRAAFDAAAADYIAARSAVDVPVAA
jgi:hypothetical protein